MSVIIRDATNPSNLAAVGADGSVAVRLNGLRPALGTFAVQSTTSSYVTLIAAGVGFTDIITLVLTNEGTATLVSITDGTNTYVFALGANAGLPISYLATLPATSSATVWQIKNSASQTVDASGVYVND